MGQTTVTNRYTGLTLTPVYNQEDALEDNVNLAPSTVFPKGQILLPVSAAANDVQTLTVGGTPTSGTFPITGVNPLTAAAFSITVNFNSTVVQTQALIDGVFGAGNVVVSGGTLPGATQIFTGAASLANTPIPLMVGAVGALAGGTPTVAVVHTTVGATLGTYSAYSGSGTPTRILKHACSTDASGNISYAASATGGPWGETSVCTPAYFSGIFSCADLVGLDAAAVTAFKARLLSGTTTAGILDIPN